MSLFAMHLVIDEGIVIALSLFSLLYMFKFKSLIIYAVFEGIICVVFFVVFFPLVWFGLVSPV